MRAIARTLVLGLLLLPAADAFGQQAVDPSGHWEGTIDVPGMEMKFELDLVRNEKGDVSGTFGEPRNGIKALPLATVAVDGRTVRFAVKGNAGVSTFEGAVSADGTSIAGQVTHNGESAPFKLTRTGDARVVATPKSAAIAPELEGTWHGSLEASGKTMRIVLTLQNQPDGSSKGTIASPDGSGVAIPVGLAQKGSSLTVDVPAIGGAYAGAMNAAGTELSGTWTQGPSTLPLTFRRAQK